MDSTAKVNQTLSKSDGHPMEHQEPPTHPAGCARRAVLLSLLRDCHRLRGCFNQGVGRQLLVQYCQFATISLEKSFEASS